MVQVNFFPGRFNKQTARGWDHTVQVTLGTVDGQHVLRWGKERLGQKTKDKELDLTRLEDVAIREINGIFNKHVSHRITPVFIVIGAVESPGAVFTNLS